MDGRQVCLQCHSKVSIAVVNHSEACTRHALLSRTNTTATRACWGATASEAETEWYHATSIKSFHFSHRHQSSNTAERLHCSLAYTTTHAVQPMDLADRNCCNSSTALASLSLDRPCLILSLIEMKYTAHLLWIAKCSCSCSFSYPCSCVSVNGQASRAAEHMCQGQRASVFSISHHPPIILPSSATSLSVAHFQDQVREEEDTSARWRCNPLDS